MKRFIQHTVGMVLAGLALIPGVFSQKRIALPPEINTSCEEREPTPSPDGSSLYFWRRECADNTAGKSDPGDIWVAPRMGNSWGKPLRANYPLNTYGQDFVWQISQRNDTLWMCQTPPAVRDHGMSFSVRKGTSWSVPRPVNIPGLETNGGYKDFFIGPGRRLLVVNQGPESLGGSDLYICFPKSDTSWSAPVHLGGVVNSAGDEDAPVISPDGQYLYFSSDGRGGKGGHDIYFSKRIDQTWKNWTTPEPLGAPVNTAQNDFDFYFSFDGKHAYWASRDGEKPADLYELDLTSCETTIYPDRDLTLCNGELIILEAGFIQGNTLTYQWYLDGKAIPGAVQRQYPVDKSGSYEVERNRDGCVSRSAARQIRFVEPPRSAVETLSPYLCPEGTVTLRSSNLSSALTYQWTKNSLPIPGATRSFTAVNTPGFYTVEVSDGGCVAEAVALEVKLLSPPMIMLAKDTTEGFSIRRPEWHWTNKIPETKSKKIELIDVAAATDGRAIVVRATGKGKQKQDEIVVFGSEGLVRSRIAGEPYQTGDPVFAVTNEMGHLVVARKSPLLVVYDAKGRMLWRKEERCGTLLGLATDPLGNIFTAGTLTDTLIFDGQFLEVPKRGGLFVAKHDPEGNLLWVKAFAVDFFQQDYGNVLSADGMGNVYFMGGFERVANFNPHLLKAGITGLTYFVTKINTKGEVLWAKDIPQPERARVRTAALAVDAQGRAYSVFNREIYVFDAGGRRVFQGGLETPEPVIRHRIAAREGEACFTGVTAKGEVYISVMNRIYNQTNLWSGKGADPTLTGSSLVSAAGDYLVFAGQSEGHNFPGIQFDLTSNNEGYIMKYGPALLQAPRGPVMLCGPDPMVLVTPRTGGAQFQWMQDGVPIPGANSSRLLVRVPGSYAVRNNAASCSLTSKTILVEACKDQPLAATPPAPKPAATPKPDPIPTPEPEVVAEKPLKMPNRLSGRKVKTQKTAILTGTDAVIEIWDRGAVDNDTVSVNLNGQWIVQNYCLQKNHYEVAVKLQRGENYLVMYAHNLGAVPPNTASLVLKDGNQTVSLELKSSLHSSGAIRIRVE